MYQGTHATEKTGKWQKIFPVRENTGNSEILPKLSLILKVKDVSIFATKISIFSEELYKAVLCM